MAAASVRQAHCNTCGGDRAHDVHATVERTGTDEFEGHAPIDWSESNCLAQCRGCGEVKLVRSAWNSLVEETSDEHFPPRAFRRPPPWAAKLPYEARELLDEVYAALHGRGLRLAVMGVRAVLDVVLVAKIGDVGTFDGKLRAFEARQFITEKQREFLDAALDLGSAAAHRGHGPTLGDVQMALDIVESMLQQVYALEDAAARLRANTPRRPPRAPPAP